MFFSIIHIFVTALILFYFSINKILFSPTLQFKKVHNFCKNTKHKRCASSSILLDQQQTMTTVLKNNNMKRTSLSTLSRGIITIEATIAITLFTLAMASILFLFNILYVQNIYSERISQILRTFSENACVNNTVLDYIATKSLFIDADIEKICTNNYISNGINGLDFTGTYFNQKDGVFTISLSYAFSLPFLDGIQIFESSISKSIKVFNGIELSEKPSDVDFYVYMTFSGNVYHTNKYCSYLVHYTEVYDLTTSMVMSLPACERCMSFSSNPRYAYKTSSGDVYHISLDCPVFQQNIYAVKYSKIQAGNTYYKLCERCKGYIS